MLLGVSPGQPLPGYAQFGPAFDPAGDAQAFVLGGLQVVEVLLESWFIELGQEARLGRQVEATDVVDELTFVHGILTVRKTTTLAVESDKSQVELETEPTMSQSPQTPPNSQTPGRPNGPGRPEGDPLAHLHRMSTTAGISNEEYVAINPWAVAAIIFSVASTLVLLNPILLVVPLTGLVCGLIAWRQIARSNGTQTGRNLAVIGLVLSLVFVALSGGRQAYLYARARSDAGKIDALVHQLSVELGAGAWEKAYALFDPRFQERVPLAKFALTWQNVMESPVGKISDMRWNGVTPSFLQDPDGESRMAQARVQIHIRPSSQPAEGGAAAVMGETMDFRLVNGQWKIYDFATLFPTQRAATP